MKRVLTVLFIAGYIGVLTYGNLCHVLRSGVSAHPLMYMIVWDMFCGWSAFDSRIHIVAEGESEKYYDLTHAPWGELHPYGYIGRENYDQWQSHTGPMGINVLRHTRHEPITRLFVIEECWAKKFNLPDHIWQRRYDDPKDAQHYFRTRVVLLPTGRLLQTYNSWVANQASQLLYDNPRLVEQSKLGRPMFVIDNVSRRRDVPVETESAGGVLPTRVIPPAALSGN
jgi:hypothetical protein